jgi:glycosyltransferase involved in cell wall biosynthesis
VTLGAESSVLETELYDPPFPVEFAPPASVLDWGPRAILRGLPLSVAKYSTPALCKKVLELVPRFNPDLLWFDHAQLGLAAARLKRTTGVPTVIRAHNLEWKIFQRNAENTLNPLRRFALAREARLMAGFEQMVGGQVDAIISVSALEKEWFAQFNPPGKVLLMPAGFSNEIEALAPLGAKARILHVAPLDWVPNAEGLRWFLEKVLPAVRHENPLVEVDVVGRNPPEYLVAPFRQDPSVHFHGFVEDLSPFEKAASCLIVPLMAGGGVRIKILNAMAQGLPVVTTAVGCEGLPVQDGQHVLLADSPEGFARALVKILRAGPEVERMRLAAQGLVEREFSWQNLVAKCLNELQAGLIPIALDR